MNRIATPRADIEALADSLSDSADALHKRIMRAIGQNAASEGTNPGQAITHEQAQALFDQEVALRQHANALYTEATRHVAAGGGVPARELLDLAAAARDRIRHIERVKDLAGIAAALLTAAVADGHPERLPAALKELKAHVASLREPKDG
jgi:hypothetical protein